MPHSVDPELRRCLDVVLSDGDRVVTAQDVGQIIEEVLATLDGDVDLAPVASASVGQDVAADEEAAQVALAALHDDGSGQSLFEEMQSELDAVVQVARDAAEAILAATESIEGVSDIVESDDGEILSGNVNSIYQACGFQDLTGQRIARICQLLERVEFQVTSAHAALGDDAAAQRQRDLSNLIEQEDTRKVEHILHGPQDAGTANSQEEIDKILASFD